MTISKPKEKIADLAKSLIENLLALTKTKAGLVVEEDKKQGLIRIKIKPDDGSGLLIGARGETLKALQSFVSLALRQKIGEWVPVSLDVAGYLSKQEEKLSELATQTAERAKTTGVPQNLYNLTSQQRRIIHVFLGEDKDVETVSDGEGEERFLIVKPKTK